MSKYNWTRQETKDLITLYEINECLWNKNLREYKDRDERISSIQSISDEMKISIEEINKKIHNLRNQYRFELNKMKKNIPGKPRYVTKWPYYKNLSFLENIVSVRGSNQQNSTNGDYTEANEFTMEKYDDENENSNDETNGNVSNDNSTTILATTGSTANNSQPQQIFHVSVEYEEEAKPKVIKSEINGRKRRLMTKDVEISPQILGQYQAQTSSSSPSTKMMPTIIIDDKSQDKNDAEEAKHTRTEEVITKLDKFEVFGMFVANEMKSLPTPALQKKLKRKILECILEINDDQDGANKSTS
ncbi:hypothetical protein PVAND_008535 [Polypedilum vanderplanki]|uniref:MADF domain-containing protein n=1 Tax=Polypedilum vanderplanki TaxID=319348 RepID=A0A9J6CA97_POLVA|nr:hypothetical protein PVAND_008535 [Polypedilum vanderplanki]